MLDFLFKKETVNSCDNLNNFYSKLKNLYPDKNISEERKEYLKSTVQKYGYLPYPQVKALEELTNAEVLYALETKWELNGVFKDGSFNFTKASVLARNNVKDSSWLQKEGHNIQLTNLAGLGNGNNSKDCGKFMDWMRQLLILPSGNLENNIFSTTMYLIPFHPREFGCAYLPTASCVSPNLEDSVIKDKTGLNADEQVKMFIQLTQLAGHPVIYDILPQTGRFSKIVLTNPDCARWFDINAIIEELLKNVDKVVLELSEKYSKEDLEIVSNIYKKDIKGESYGDLTEHYKKIFDEINEKLRQTKIFLSNSMLEKSIQDKLHKKARTLINKFAKNNRGKKMSEKDILNQSEIIQGLITEGMWPAPGGAWCSAGVPVFDKMSEGASYPTFKHYKYDGIDVSKYANLDCQTPYYFVCLENGKYNNDVVKFFIDYMKNLQEEYNFDGFRVDHIDHIVDKVSQFDELPISYRAPKVVLAKANKEMKSIVPHFATLAEYMLWDGFLKEYHIDMGFDLLWGNDIISQSDKKVARIFSDLKELEEYNSKLPENISKLSILKSYNNQDGEFAEIDQYPGQLGEDGALLKFFKYKFIVGGPNAQRPVMYVDGDESFTKTGTEFAIGNETSLKRENHNEFFKKFNAIIEFAKTCKFCKCGKSYLLRNDEDGFVAWVNSLEGYDNQVLFVVNENYPSEKIRRYDKNGNLIIENVIGQKIKNKMLDLGSNVLLSEFIYMDGKFLEKNIENTDKLFFETINPAQYYIYRITNR